MIRQANLIRFNRLAESGRNQPLLVTVETSDEVEHDAFMKPAGWSAELTKKSVVKECIASLVGNLASVPLCEPFLVHCSDEMMEGIVSEDIRRRLQRSAWPAYASRHAGRQWGVWASGTRLDPDSFDDALSILAFDAFIDNSDRCHRNPNLLTKGSELRAIDHEMGFAFPDLILVARPP